MNIPHFVVIYVIAEQEENVVKRLKVQDFSQCSGCNHEKSHITKSA